MVQVQLSTFPQRAIFHNFQNYRLEWQPTGAKRFEVADSRAAFSGGFAVSCNKYGPRLRRSVLRLYVENISRKAIYLGGHILCLDRKSTRLNSSHMSISYAVF